VFRVTTLCRIVTSMKKDFELHPRLAADTHLLGRLDLSLVLLHRDAGVPWCNGPGTAGLRRLQRTSGGLPVDQATLM